jgi:hypothetical protein
MISPLGRVVIRTQALRAAKPLTIRQFTSASQCLAPAAPATKRATTKAAVSTKVKAVAPKSVSTTTKKAAPVTKKAAAPATKKPTAKAVAAKKPVAKKAAVKKPKAVAKVVKKPKKVKKTDEQEQSALIKDLKEKALDPPAIRSTSNKWLTFLGEKFAPYKGSGKSFIDVLSQNKDAWKAEMDALPPAQLQELQARADRNKNINKIALQEWVSSHTPAQIHEANRARARLTKIKSSADPAPYGLQSFTFNEIPDDRFPKRPRSAPIFWGMEQMEHIPTNEKIKVLIECMKGFKNLPENEQKKWNELAKKDRERYLHELIAAGIEPSAHYKNLETKPAAAAPKKTA